MRSSRSSTLLDTGLVFVGGAAGTLLRALVLLPEGAVWERVGIPAVNVLGAFALGLLAGLLGRGALTLRRSRLRLLVGTGLLGGFTTYSAFATQTASQWWLAIAVATVCAGTLAAWLGMRLGRGRGGPA